MEPLTFLAEIAPTDCALQFGHDGARVEIWSKPIVADFAQASQLVGYTNKVLRLAFFLPKGDEPVIEFLASVAPLNSAIRFTKDTRVKVKFDVPETEKTKAARLAGMAEKVFSLEVSLEGDKEKRPPKAKEPVTPNGRLWQILDQYGFHNRPDVRAWLGCASVSENDAKRFLRMKFNVESRKDVSATRLLDEMGYYNTEIEPNALDGAITFVQSLYNE